MTDRLQAIEDKLRTGQLVTFDEAADLFELTATGASYNQPRAVILQHLHAKFPDTAALTAAMRAYLAQFDAMNRPGRRH